MNQLTKCTENTLFVLQQKIHQLRNQKHWRVYGSPVTI